MSYAQRRRYAVLQWQAVPDGVLVGQAQAGDQRAFEVLVNRYHPLLASYIAGLLQDSAQVADVLQQVDLQLYLSLPTLRTTASLKGWLFQVAHRRCLDELRKRRRRAEDPFSRLTWDIGEEDPSPVESIPDPEPLPEEVAEDHDLYRSLQEAIATLPPRLRPIVLLRCFGELTFRQIARHLDMKETAVKTCFYRALPRLRRALAADVHFASVS